MTTLMRHTITTILAALLALAIVAPASATVGIDGSTHPDSITLAALLHQSYPPEVLDVVVVDDIEPGTGRHRADPLTG